MDRDKVDLKVGQKLIVKLTDMDGPKTDWIVTSSGSSALKGPTHKPVAGANGALNLDVYEYVGAAPGQQELTFSYRQPEQQPTTDDTMRVTVTVR
jgi:predicted secreted protein